MPVNVEKEIDTWFNCVEHCCICRAKTRFWFTKKDVALCKSCAEKVDEKDIPSKQEWCEKESKLSDSFIR